MSLIEESYIQSLLRECDADFGRQQKQAIQAVNNRLTQIYKIFKKNIKYTFDKFSLEVIVHFMELAVQINQKFQYAEEFIQLFFERVTAPSQFYIRALLVKALCIAYRGHITEYKGEAMISILKQSIQEISKALSLIASPPDPNAKGKDSKGGVDPNKARYSFLVYNASTCLYKITRFMLRQHWQKNFTDIYERIYKLFDQFDEPDQNWRCKFALILFQCLYDNDKKPDAFKILDLLWERAKSKNCDILDSLFRLRVHLSKQNAALGNIIKKDIQGADPNAWKILEVLQKMKSGAIPQAQIQKQLMGVVNQISLGVLSPNQQTASVTLSHIMQQRLAQAGRIALKFNIVSIASSITNFLSKVRQPNQKAMVLNQYNKAQLQIKKKNQFIDKRTGMIMSASQIKELEIESRKQALKTLQKVMMVNKKLNNPDLIYEGAVLIWNITLPFMSIQYREHTAKAFDISAQLLEQIDSVDHDLRSKMHLQLAKIYFGNQQMFHEVQKNIMKAIKLDHSIPVNKLQFKFQPEEDPSLYHRPYERYLNSYREKILLKTMQNMDVHELDTVTSDLWNVVQQKSETARIDTLQKCLRTLFNITEQKFVVDETQMLVEEEIKERKIVFEQKKLRLYKKTRLLAAEVAELAFEWEMNDFAKKACQFVLEDTWEGKNSLEMVIVQAKCQYFLGQIFIDEIVQDNYEVPFLETVELQPHDENKVQLSQENKKLLQQKKKIVFQRFRKGAELAQSIQQHWLVFNGAIYIWNNFLHIFRNPINDSKLHPEICNLLKKFFESLKNSLKQIEGKNIVYYDLDTKIQVFANIGLTYARIMEGQKQVDEVLKVCEALLATQLPPHTRKLTNSMKARITSGKGGAAGGKDQKKGGKDVAQEKTTGYNDSFLFEIFSQLEVIQNSTNKGQTENLIKKCMQSLENWKPKDKDEMQLELNAELWARLARLAVNQQTTLMYKIAIKCSNFSLSVLDVQKKIGSIPSNRLRWYSLSEFLYSESLFKIANPETQDVQSYEKLMFAALEHSVEATHKGYRANINALVIDGAKQVWNIASKLQQNQKNRIKLLHPLKSVLIYLKQTRQDSQPDLILLLAQLFFRTANQNNESKIGEQIADSLFSLVPKNLQKSIWQAKMVFMSKQGKNQLQAISNMKEADPSLQAKLWVKLARISNNQKKQFAAYNKAIDILKKQNSIQIVEVLIEYAEWQLRAGNEKVKNVTSTLLLASDYLIDIQYGEEDEEDDDENDNQEDKGTVFSRSTRGKQSHASKSKRSSVKGEKATKKNLEKKGSSFKNGSNNSRMSRSGKVAKVNKSKNAKSIFSQRQEDPNPESLNCIHFERLFRIHTILAMIADHPSNRIRYALDAKHFLLKILQISFDTFNNIQENATKFAEKSSQVQKTQDKLKIPESAKEWANFSLPKQFLDKIKILQDPNFMGTYSFEKPELTLSYLKNICKILTGYGLDLHTIPVIFLQKYLTKHIICNQEFFEVTQLQMMLCLNKIDFYDPEKPHLTKPDKQKYKITETAKKQQLIKTKSKIAQDKNQNEIFQNVHSPNLIKPLAMHQAWFYIGKLLLQFGEIQPAKIYINQSLKHFKILANSESAGEACIYLLLIAIYEGQSQQGMQYALLANKLCKSILNWQKLLLVSSKLLLSLKKYNDLANFAIRIYQVVSQIINNLTKSNEQKQMFESQIIDLKDILILVELIDLNLRFTESIQEKTTNGSNLILHAILELQSRLEKNNLWKIQHYQYFYEIAYNIMHFFIFGKNQYYPQINQTIFQKIFNLLLNIEKAMFELMKYTLIGTSADFVKNSLIHLYRKYRFIIAEGYSYEQTLGQLTALDQEENDKVEQLDSENKMLKKYIQTLNLEIQKKISPLPTNLTPAQSSLSILANLRPNINQESYQYILWLATKIRALTFKAKSEGCLRNVWKKHDADNEDQQLESAAVSLDAIDNFISNNYEDKLLNLSQNIHSFDIGQKMYEAFVENTGQQLSKQSFEFLCKMQHCSYSNSIIKQLQKNLSNSHKFNALLRLLESSKLNKQQVKTILEKDKIFSSLFKFPKFEQCLNLIPKNGIYVILQFTNDQTEMYYGCAINQKVGEQYQMRYIMNKKSIEKEQLLAYKKLHLQLSNVKRQISYLAYDDDEKLVKALGQKQIQLQKIMTQLNKLSSWWLHDLVTILSKVNDVPVVEETDKNKKGAKDAKKKGGKDQVSAYQSPLGTTPAGFQSITFLLGQQFYGLPFDYLKGLEIVPAVSMNKSIYYLSRKMQVMGYKADVNNSNGFGGDKGKYITYEFKDQSLSFKQFAANIVKNSPNIKLDGLSSTTRIPSVGDFSKYLGEQGFLEIYGSLDFLNYIKVPLLLENIGSNKCRLLIIHDHLNYRKSLLNKFLPLDDKSYSNSIEEEDKILSMISDLLDINLIKNRWTSTKQSNQSIINKIYKTIGAGNYIGAINFKPETQNKQDSEANKLQLIERLLMTVYGCPVLRL